MDDKRIKLITKEMFIAWALICASFVILDAYCWQVGIFVFPRGSEFLCLSTNSFRPSLSDIGFIAYFLIMFSNFLALVFSYFIVNVLSFIPPPINHLFWISAFIYLQILFWGFFGKLAGEFVIWTKHFRKKSLPELNSIQD